jgi:hypothetical protein
VAKIRRIDSLRGRKRKPKERERITPEALAELVSRHSQCVLDQQQKCQLIMFAQAMAWELNVFFGVGNDEDKAFRRCDDMPAAKPLTIRREEE